MKPTTFIKWSNLFIIAPVIKYTKYMHFKEAPFLSFGHPSPKGGRTKSTVVQALAPNGGHEAQRRAAKRKWHFSAEGGFPDETVINDVTV